MTERINHKSCLRTWKIVPLIFIVHVAIQIGILTFISKHLERISEIPIPPTTIEDAQKISSIFHTYYETHFELLVLFHCSCFFFLQTWCIPGTFIFNLLGGALFDIKLGFVLCVLMNTVGGFTCYLISKLCLGDIVHNKLRAKFEMLSERVNEHKDNIFFYLTFLRVFPGSPNWLMNISFAHINSIKWYQVFFSIFFGLMPWNFFTCEGGQILANIRSKSDVIKTETYIQLALIAFACLVPPLAKKYFLKSDSAISSKAKVE